ncbi:hypothetical protein B296_00021973 [Ensete ventricosum]|uniref:Solanesyl diphosphate synthase n=1 Tax=Ensete ventricosum TaxID=4639 RepID=A0A426ZBL5_ENSVE|nr:hypothetical protein B296_00021973 [Ensete ventricosum]
MLSLTCPSVDLCQSGCLSRRRLRPQQMSGSRRSGGVRCMVSTIRRGMFGLLAWLFWSWRVVSVVVIVFELAADVPRAGEVMSVTAESSSERDQVSSLLEVVSGDMKMLNENLKSVIKDFASGEIKQASSLFDCDLTLEDYLLKSYYKTASLIASSAKSAAIFSNVSTSICEQMYEYGKNLGLSFQVVDDILDFTQSTEQLGKPAGSDLSKGNLTAPVIFALQKEPKLREIIDSEFSEAGSLDTAIELIHDCGGLSKAQELAKQKADLAIQKLQCLPESEYRNSLEGIVKYNLERID